MKLILALITLAFSSQVFAGYTCTDDKNTELVIFQNFRTQGITLKADDITAFYKKHIHVGIEKLETVVEDTEGPIFEETQEGYESLLKIQNSDIFNAVWNVSVSFIPNSNLKAKVQVIDMEGIEFSYVLQCVQTGGLE